jgi:predicted  nucleic acid-binding Zn-ribbon protein
MTPPRHQTQPAAAPAGETTAGADALRRLDEIERRLGELRSRPDLLGASAAVIEEVSTILTTRDGTEVDRLRRQRDGLARELSTAEGMIRTLQESVARAREESDAAMTEISRLRREVGGKIHGGAPRATSESLPIEQHVRREISKAQSELETTAANLEDYRQELDRRFAELTDWAASLQYKERELEQWAHVLEASLSPLAPGPTRPPVFVPGFVPQPGRPLGWRQEGGRG